MNYHVATGTKYRMGAILALIGIGAIGILLRAVQIQVLQADVLAEIANQQRRHTIEISARRGDILDSRGEALAVSREEAQVYARPDEIENPVAAAKKLARIINQDEKSLVAKLQSDAPFVWISRFASLEQGRAVDAVKEAGDLKGVGVLPATRRFYPGATLAANLIGFVGVDGKGLEGLESYYQKTLAGNTVHIWLERDARGKPIYLTDHDGPLGLAAGPDNPRPPMENILRTDARGTSLKLTILRPLQYLAERELAKGVEAAGGIAGCVVAMDPETGRVLAMASFPTFDPNNFSKSSQENFTNRCTASAYEPGSTFKAFLVAAALEEGVVRKNDLFFCENGTYALGGETISDTKAHGWLSVEQIIAYSSNIGASKIGERLGKERMFRAITAFGFGERTGMGFPGQSAGILRPPGQWSQVAVGTISFGQGIAATPLQMVTALCAVANGGVLMRPYLVETLIVPDGSEQTLNEPQRVRRVISPETARTVNGFMRKVVKDGGTGERAAVPGYTVSGKTGTAQKARPKHRGYAEGKYVASFMGFLPADKPRLAMIVIIDEPDPGKPYGGSVAAPVFQAIAKQAMVLLKVPSEDEYPSITMIDLESDDDATSPPKRVRRWEAVRAWPAASSSPTDPDNMTVPDLKGLTLRTALKALQGMPVGVEVSGSGVVASLSPDPGSALKPGQVVTLMLEDAP